MSRGLGRAGTDDDAGSLRRFLEQLDQIPFLIGNEIAAVVPSGVQYVIAPHGLGRAYKGFMLWSVSYPVAAFAQSSRSASIATIDVSKNVLIYLDSVVGFDVTVTGWVF